MNNIANAESPLPYPVRAEPRPCAVCLKLIQPGQLYVAGPAHVVCRPPPRVDVERLRAAARR